MAYEKTVWRDRVVEYPHRYQQTHNDDGTVNMESKPGNVLEEGTTITAERMNHLEQGVEHAHKALEDKMDTKRGDELALEIAGRASTAVYAATLASGGWSGTAPRKQTVNVEGILATDTPFVDIDMSGATTGAAGTALTDAWTLVGRVEAGVGTITAYCYDDAPTVNIPVILKVVR